MAKNQVPFQKGLSMTLIQQYGSEAKCFEALFKCLSVLIVAVTNTAS